MQKSPKSELVSPEADAQNAVAAASNNATETTSATTFVASFGSDKFSWSSVFTPLQEFNAWLQMILRCDPTTGSSYLYEMIAHNNGHDFYNLLKGNEYFRVNLVCHPDFISAFCTPFLLSTSCCWYRRCCTIENAIERYEGATDGVGQEKRRWMRSEAFIDNESSHVK